MKKALTKTFMKLETHKIKLKTKYIHTFNGNHSTRFRMYFKIKVI